MLAPGCTASSADSTDIDIDRSPLIERVKDRCFFDILEMFNVVICNCGLDVSLKEDFVNVVASYLDRLQYESGGYYCDSVYTANLVHHRIFDFLISDYFEWSFGNSQGDAPRHFWDGIRSVFDNAGMNFDDFLIASSDNWYSRSQVERWIHSLSAMARMPFEAQVRPVMLS